MRQNTIGKWLLWALRMAHFFLLYFPWKLTLACLDVAWDVVRPQNRFVQGIVEFRSRCRTDTEIALMANLISLTPGTLMLSVNQNPPTMYVHDIYCSNVDVSVARLREYEDRMLRALHVDGDVTPLSESTRSAGGDQ